MRKVLLTMSTKSQITRGYGFYPLIEYNLLYVSTFNIQVESVSMCVCPAMFIVYITAYDTCKRIIEIKLYAVIWCKQNLCKIVAILRSR